MQIITSSQEIYMQQNQNSNNNMVTSHHIWDAKNYHCNSSIQESAAMEILQYIQFQGFEKVLDIGCGDGKITAIIARNVQKVLFME